MSELPSAALASAGAATAAFHPLLTLHHSLIFCPGYCIITAGSISFVIGASKEILIIPSLPHNQIPVTALVTLHDREPSPGVLVRHKATQFRIICAEIQTQPICIFITELHGISADRASFPPQIMILHLLIPVPLQHNILIITLYFQ